MPILKYLYTVWSLFTFTFFMLLAVPVFTFSPLLFGKHSLKITLSYYKFWLKYWGLLTATDYKVQGREKLDIDQQYMFVVNHTSTADAFAINVAIQHLFTFLAKIEISRFPIMGYLIKQGGAVFVDRENQESRLKSMDEMRQNVQKGISVLVFPEGTRNVKKDRPVQDFYSGAFQIAIELQLPVAPMIIIGAENFFTDENLPVHPTTIRCIFADPISTKGLSLEELPKIKAQTHHIMTELLYKHDPQYRSQMLAEG